MSGVDLESKSQVRLLNAKGREVKNVTVSCEDDVTKISIPDIEPGNYTIEAKVSSEKGKDTVKKDIYIAKNNSENITITMDKGIYKPR